MAKKALKKENRRVMLLASIFLIAVTFVTTGIVLTREDTGSQGSAHATEQENTGNITFGYSEQDKPISGYVFGQGEECILFLAGLHGTEKGATRLLGRLVQEIE